MSARASTKTQPSKMRIGIVGGGINGYSCGVRILQHYHSIGVKVEVSIVSEDFTPNTTGDGSAGLWSPYLLGNTPRDRIIRWAQDMHDYLLDLFRSEDAGIAGVCLLPVYRVSTSDTIDDFWNDIVFGCQPLSKMMMAEFNAHRPEGKKFKCGLEFVTFTSEPRKLLPYLMNQFEHLGGLQLKRKVEDLTDFMVGSPFHAVINCTGLGSRLMVPDKRMYPVRGQVQRVRRPWTYFAVLDDSDDGNYIIPNCDTVVLGGTHQEDDYNTNLSFEDRDFIRQGCQKFIPALKDSLVIWDYVGLRPGRDEVRLEVDEAMADEVVERTKMRAAEFARNPLIKRREGRPIVIHNYGHGGSGVTLAWGCANNVLELLLAEAEKLGLPGAPDDDKAKL